ncbi:hypothetical protein [Ornithobacterium rhinotracheale]|uniref:hypothetical protein n=1 Tax=Ornithobacterium rhinotracheale TaxID=28251 RepID=UPI001FF663C4|nr:hypothetical protein [Ornithobacterium rhinotracheale]MCK0205461.1 hypothetical protein [Ornithobacterium rhinotracheale]
MVIARDYSSYVEKLGLFFSKTTPDSEEKKAQRLQAVRVAEENKERFVELGVKGLFAQDNLDNLRPQIAEAQSWGMETPIDGLVSALRGMREREDTTYLLEKLNYPILIVLGEKDPSTEKEFKDLIPKRRIYMCIFSLVVIWVCLSYPKGLRKSFKIFYHFDTSLSSTVNTGKWSE